MSESDGENTSADAQFPDQLESDRLLLVEGDFDFGFFENLLKRYGRSGVQVFSVRGVDNLYPQLEAILMSRRSVNLRWLGIARDADRDALAAFQSLRDLLIRASKHLQFDVPSTSWVRTEGGPDRCAVSLIIFPDGKTQGDFERFLWNALDNNPTIDCINSYVECLRQTGLLLPREWKTRIYSYLASLARPDMPLRAAGQASLLPLQISALESLLDLIPPDQRS